MVADVVEGGIGDLSAFTGRKARVGGLASLADGKVTALEILCLVRLARLVRDAVLVAISVREARVAAVAAASVAPAIEERLDGEDDVRVLIV